MYSNHTEEKVKFKEYFCDYKLENCWSYPLKFNFILFPYPIIPSDANQFKTLPCAGPHSIYGSTSQQISSNFKSHLLDVCKNVLRRS